MDKPRLLERVRMAIRARYYARSTEKSYVYWIKYFIIFTTNGILKPWVLMTSHGFSITLPWNVMFHLLLKIRR